MLTYTRASTHTDGDIKICLHFEWNLQGFQNRVSVPSIVMMTMFHKLFVSGLEYDGSADDDDNDSDKDIGRENIVIPSSHQATSHHVMSFHDKRCP